MEEHLCLAAKKGDTTEVSTLIAAGADVTHFNMEGLTPLMLAASHGHADVVKRLLEAGAPWNALSPSNLSAGDFAMNAGHQEAFDALVNAGLSMLQQEVKACEYEDVQIMWEMLTRSEKELARLPARSKRVRKLFSWARLGPCLACARPM